MENTPITMREQSLEDYLEHERLMSEALYEARSALELGEVPIGAIVMLDGKIIGKGHNLRNTEKNPLYHAEIIAINRAARHIGDWRLENCAMYVTIEPCPMCAGAIVTSRIKTLVFGAKNEKAGCCGSILNLLQQPRFNHQTEIISGVLNDACSAIMKEFFKTLRA